ncbi:MAG: aquaporin [Flavobacteriaceae bacterium]|nr:aquaporin [Flavobacteriaceae bacterium]|tara:strand:- start:1794 stop:2537 length:744 start_codon:yes stop_codon:yes gene_type:complete
MNVTPYIAELIGTTFLLLLGQGVVANVSLNKTKAENDPPWLLISFAWGFAVFVAVFITSNISGAHLNPAVSIGLALAGKFSWSLVPKYILAQLLGAMLGSWICYIAYIDHYRLSNNEDSIRGTFCTGPAIRNFKNNLFAEVIGTFVLVFCVLCIASPNIEIEGLNVKSFGLGSLDALPVGIVITVIGMGLGGNTGFAINPARDFGPRLIYSLVRRKNKKPDWSYSWIPIIGPCLGALIAGMLYLLVN